MLLSQLGDKCYIDSETERQIKEEAMIYTMRAGVDNQVKDKLARSLLYSTVVVVALLIAIAPFTGNNTFWNGGSNDQGSTNNKSSSGTSLNATTSSSKSTKNTGATTKTTPSTTPTPQPTASSLTGSAIAQPAGSTPIVGR